MEKLIIKQEEENEKEDKYQLEMTDPAKLPSQKEIEKTIRDANFLSKK